MRRITITILLVLSLSACEEYGKIKVYGDKDKWANEKAGVRNFIKIEKLYDSTHKSMIYFTGGSSGGSNYIEQVPMKEVSRAEREGVLVKTYSNLDYSSEYFNSLSKDIINTVYDGTETIWPKANRPLSIEYFVMGKKDAYTFAKKVKWQEGEPLQLAVFEKEGNEHSGTVLHEYYHLLSDIYKIGLSDPIAVSENLYRYYGTYEELAGDLYGYCGELLANQEFKFNYNKMSMDFNSKLYRTPLSDDDVKEVIELVALNKFPETRRYILTYVLMNKVLNGQKNIEINSPEGKKLLRLCSLSAGNPTYLESWFYEAFK